MYAQYNAMQFYRTTSPIYAGTYDIQAPVKQKSLHRSRRNFAQLIISVRLSNVPEIVGIGSLGEAPQIGDLQAIVTFVYRSLYHIAFFPVWSQTRPLDRFACTMA
jgi:hypothetical protein